MLSFVCSFIFKVLYFQPGFRRKQGLNHHALCHLPPYNVNLGQISVLFDRGVKVSKVLHSTSFVNINSLIDERIYYCSSWSKGEFNPVFPVWQWPTCQSLWTGQLSLSSAELTTAQVIVRLSTRQGKLRKRIWRQLWESQRDFMP